PPPGIHGIQRTANTSGRERQRTTPLRYPRSQLELPRWHHDPRAAQAVARPLEPLWIGFRSPLPTWESPRQPTRPIRNPPRRPRLDFLRVLVASFPECPMTPAPALRSSAR